MQQGLTIREAADAVEVCRDTAFRWRHRFLENVQDHQPKGITGILEVDETYFRESQKGSRELTRPARKRGGKATGSGRYSKDWVPVLVGRARGQSQTVDKVLTRVNGAEVTDALKDAVKPGETILCTDGHSAFLHLQRTLGVQTKSFIASRAVPGLDKVYHVQSANNYHERLKTWVQRKLRGVASKNLPNYLAWMRLMTWNRDGVNPEEIVASALGRQIINL
jgi:transposase-like protein